MKRPIYYLLILSFLFLQSFSSHLFAIDTVPVLWKLSAKTPDIIFREGFPALGTSTNLLEFLRGETHLSSVFQPASSHATDESFLENVLNNLILPAQPIIGWVYEIVPSEDFFELKGSLEAFLGSIEAEFLIPAHKSLFEEMLSQAEFYGDWFSKGSIPGHHIKSATHWVFDRTGELDADGNKIFDWKITSLTLHNPKYLKSVRNASTNPYPIFENTSPADFINLPLETIVEEVLEQLGSPSSIPSVPTTPSPINIPSVPTTPSPNSIPALSAPPSPTSTSSSTIPYSYCLSSPPSTSMSIPSPHSINSSDTLPSLPDVLSSSSSSRERRDIQAQKPCRRFVNVRKEKIKKLMPTFFSWFKSSFNN